MLQNDKRSKFLVATTDLLPHILDPEALPGFPTPSVASTSSDSNNYDIQDGNNDAIHDSPPTPHEVGIHRYIGVNPYTFEPIGIQVSHEDIHIEDVNIKDIHDVGVSSPFHPDTFSIDQLDQLRSPALRAFILFQDSIIQQLQAENDRLKGEKLTDDSNENVNKESENVIESEIKNNETENVNRDIAGTSEADRDTTGTSTQSVDFNVDDLIIDTEIFVDGDGVVYMLNVEVNLDEMSIVTASDTNKQDPTGDKNKSTNDEEKLRNKKGEEVLIANPCLARHTTHYYGTSDQYSR
ncbi:hypothetical protein L1987_48365 [Smallanthus sonchifolius]|uniref:Uncharacterized protein n=1 Tax=Smallanthus sonchifolius TaxID=185202 RepID=A0ACB9FR50_9ASTR|nr:hypothetical protein L1987_48365 [Smallanthus sonchifolius]